VLLLLLLPLLLLLLLLQNILAAGSAALKLWPPNLSVSCTSSTKRIPTKHHFSGIFTPAQVFGSQQQLKNKDSRENKLKQRCQAIP